MNPHSHLETIYFAAREKASPEERAAYLAEACGADAGLHNRVEQMLAADGTGFLNHPPEELDETSYLEAPAQLGAQIGPYKLLQQIGEGGMGVVYMAKQSRPVERVVALKIIKQGMDTRQVVARFEAERQALALMDHPNIARVLDAGATDAGRPYFVMELVRGVPVTQYCDEHRLNVRERLELFLPVCHAVQHAHQKGIIHRDLKPSNVLVAEYDELPMAKVIDFGVAKAVGQRLTERTLFTEFGQVMGTFEYMSPEQAKLNQLDIDTRTDVYSLGVLLYELLTGETPHDRQRLRSAALDEVLRIIREDDPPRPSTRLSSNHTLSQIAANRRAEASRLPALLRGELDWIVMKCLEKERARRYETANGLARDIERFLHDEPVQACPPSISYRVQKFARRNAVAIFVVTLVALSLIAATCVSMQQAVRAQRASALAEKRLVAEQQARQETSAVNELFQEALASANPDANKGASYTVRQLLDDIAERLDTKLHGLPAGEAAARATIGTAYQRLGMHDKAEPHLARALEIRRELHPDSNLEVADSLLDYARLKSETGAPLAAIDMASEALDIHVGLETPATDRVKVLDELALQLWAVQSWDQLDPIVKQIREIAEKHPEAAPQYANLLHRLAETMSDPVAAEQRARESVALHKKYHGETHPETAWGIQALGKTLRRQGKLEDAEECYREALRIFRLHYDNSGGPVACTLANLAAVLRYQNDQSALTELSREAKEFAQTSSSDFDHYLYGGSLHAHLGQWPQAEKCFDMVRKTTPSYFETSIRRLAWIRLQMNDIEGFRRLTAELESQDTDLGLHTLRLLVVTPNSGIPARTVLAAAKTHLINIIPTDADAATVYGAALFRSGRYDEAYESLAAAVAPKAERRRISEFDAQFFLAMTEYRLGRTSQARARLEAVVASSDFNHSHQWLQVFDSWMEPIAFRTLRSEAEATLNESSESIGIFSESSHSGKE